MGGAALGGGRSRGLGGRPTILGGREGRTAVAITVGCPPEPGGPLMPDKGRCHSASDGAVARPGPGDGRRVWSAREGAGGSKGPAGVVGR